MPSASEKITTEVSDLVELGVRILRQTESQRKAMKGDALAEVTGWVTRLGQSIRRLYGEESQEFSSYSDALATERFYYIHSNWNAHISKLVGIAKAIQHDLESGLLIDIRALLQADVFADFLEMADYLLNEGYKDPAAVLIGAVLEDGLRRLLEKHGLPVAHSSGRPLTIEPMNAALAKAGVYNKLVQKQITSWAHVRNSAAHGKYDEYTKAQVQLMLLFVQGFAAEHVA